MTYMNRQQKKVLLRFALLAIAFVPVFGLSWFLLPFLPHEDLVRASIAVWLMAVTALIWALVITRT
jgi:hypothetical protein